ncbi:MAG: NAD(P)-dependent alcohol dehydrogenase [Actinomycetota bacterium]
MPSSERRRGAFAECAVARETNLAHKPKTVSFVDAAAVPTAGLTALQGLRDHGQLASGQRVLVIGASGGVGVYTVQIAKSLDARVTAMCSTRNTELVKSIRADDVIDYRAQDCVHAAGCLSNKEGEVSSSPNREVSF